MGKKRRILLAALLVVVLGGLVWFVMSSGPPEPLYKGMPVSYWLREPGIGHFPQMDSNAVPFLVRALQTRDGPLDRGYIRAWNNSPLWLKNHLPRQTEDWIVRTRAASLLAQIGRDAEPAIPALVRALKEDEYPIVRCFSAQALGSIGKNDMRAREALKEALQDKDKQVRDGAGVALTQIDPEAAAKAGVK